jgi:transcriptional regulator with PAS, ATPase and Fis domain
VERPYEQLLQLLRVPFTGFLEFDYGDTWKAAFEEHVKYACDGVRSAKDRVIGQVDLEKIERLRARTKDCFSRDGEIVGNSPAMLKELGTVASVAPKNATVLICGESGTGKELIAKALHANSPRYSKPFVAVDTGCLSAELLESTLFGHLKGAFTGATFTKKGSFQVADGGTLFLDEIANMGMGTQAKVLRVLQDHRFTPLGSDKEIGADVRIIAATNVDLMRAIDEGKFREDLYYRLAVVLVEPPPLRNRLEDIEELAEHFLGKISKENVAKAQAFSPAALRKLRSYRWPGNVRQLHNAIVSAIVLNTSETIIDANHIEIRSVDEMRDELIDGSWKAVQDDKWVRTVKALLTKHHGIVSDVAKELGQDRSHISRKIREHKLTNFAARLRSKE